MVLRPLHHVGRHIGPNVIAYLALFFALGAGGSYALAASASNGTIGVCVDNALNLAQLRALDCPLDVYIELEVGMNRCGVPPGEPVVALAKQIGGSLRFAGLQAYHGRAQHMRSMEERHAAIETAAQHVFHTKKLLEKNNIACPILKPAPPAMIIAGSSSEPCGAIKLHNRIDMLYWWHATPITPSIMPLLNKRKNVPTHVHETPPRFFESSFSRVFNGSVLITSSFVAPGPATGRVSAA